MDFNFQPGDKLIIELEANVFEGVYESGTQNRIDVGNVVEYPAGTTIPGTLCFYRSEIVDIKILSTLDKTSDSSNTSGERENRDNVINLEEDQYKKLEKNLIEHTYICTIDRRYYDLIDLIRNCECVSITGFNSQPGRLSKLSLIVLSVFHESYLIDVQQFKKRHIPCELRDLIESERIKKVVFAAGPLFDSLYHCHNINKPKNIFDIQMADLFIQKKIKKEADCSMRSLSECLGYYLNLPKSLLNVDTNELPSVNWEERPLLSSTRKIAIQQCMYLNALKNYMEKIMMSTIYDATNLHYQTLINSKSLQTTDMFQELSVPQNVLELL